mmetsp:Transcript_43932/g.139985  ORF Transcript_43932/g.139985 Transcript_43932/m.139985 type:complete len:298 (-) Transcript_43932:21-914(-)
MAPPPLVPVLVLALLCMVGGRAGGAPSMGPRSSGPPPPAPPHQDRPRAPTTRPAFPEAYTADIDQQLIKVDGKPLRDSEVVETTVYYDRKRHAERVDVHSYRTSYLFLYGQGKAYMTSSGSCFTAVLTKPIISPKLPASAEFVGEEEEVNGIPKVERWRSNVPVFTTAEELWVKRSGRDFWPVREVSTRGAGREELQVQTEYRGFDTGRIDPDVFKAPPPSMECIPFPGDQFDLAMQHRNTLHFNPVFIPHNKPIDAVPRDVASAPPPNLHRPRGGVGRGVYQQQQPPPVQPGMRWQ